MDKVSDYIPIVRDFMSTEVFTVHTDTPLYVVAKLLHEKRLSCLLVVSDDALIGVVTERDITNLAARLYANNAPESLSGIMTSPLITIDESAHCTSAIEILQTKGIRRLIVTNVPGKVSGLITKSDLLRAHTYALECERRMLEERVLVRTQELETLTTRLQELSLIDPLLGIGNRRSMEHTLAALYERTRRYKRPYSIALLDIDQFKIYNDHFGHQRGDKALTDVAAVIKKTIRITDSVFRYGGEEFLIALPEVGIAGAVVAAEHVRRAVEGLNIPHITGESGVVTCSIGVAEERIDSPDQTATIAAADKALYAAKQIGRNRVVGEDHDS